MQSLAGGWTVSVSNTIFIVDDQASILETVAAILTDERYDVRAFSSAEDLLTAMESDTPNLVLLDIWLPGIDGVETLKKLRLRHTKLPIILMSGHAGVDIAVGSMKAGATDFLEKPLNLDVLLEKLAQHLPGRNDEKGKVAGRKPAPTLPASGRGAKVRIVESATPQRTLKQNAVLNGVGLLSGRPTGIIISPRPINAGLVFKTLEGVDIPAHVSALENFQAASSGANFTANSTALSKGGRRIRTVEHLMGALQMLGVTNASIKVAEEIPNVDGSAADFCRMIESVGVVSQEAPRYEVEVVERIGIGNVNPDEKYLYVEPFNGYEVNMRVNYPAPIFEQNYTFNPTRQDFIKEIAPARSFNTFENIDMAQKMGMAGSGYLNSHIIMHDGKVINTELKFPDEFVRHKILDLIGDLSLLGFAIRGRVVANMTSHGLKSTAGHENF